MATKMQCAAFILILGMGLQGQGLLLNLHPILSHMSQTLAHSSLTP